MTTTTPSHAHQIVYQQARYDMLRRFLRDYLLRPIGLGLLVKADVEGIEHVPTSGPAILMMNHIAAIDPFVVAAVVTSRFPVPMTKIENYRNPFVGLIARSWGAYPVRRGEIDRQALDSTVALLNQGRLVLIAPEGTRHPTLQTAKGGLTYAAIKTGAMIVPTAVDGTDQFPKSLTRLRRAQVRVRFGRPFRFRIQTHDRLPRQETRQMTQEAMYQLAALLPEHRRGVYHDLSQMTTEYLEF